MTSKGTPTPALPKRLSLVAQTVQSLCEGIRTGHWKEHLPGERELCERLQVSRRTISAALVELQRKGWLDVSHRQRRRIKAPRATRGTNGQKKVIAVLSPRPFHAILPPMTLVMDALRDKFTEAGGVVEFHVNQACFSARPAHALDQLIHDHPADVWLILGSKEPMQRWFIERQLPCLVAGSCAPGIVLPSVDVDYRAACRHAGDVLWRKGHRRLALVQPLDAYDGDVESEHGFREALNKHPEAQLRVIRHDGTATHLGSLLDKAMHSAHPPTAYLVVHAHRALTVAMHLMRRKLRLPQDAAVISRDNENYLQHTSPVLSRYAVDPVHFARKLSKAVCELAETGVLAPRAIRLIPKFIAGETV